VGRILDAAIAFFEQDDWKYTRLAHSPVLRLGFAGENGQWTCFAREREEQEQFIFSSQFPAHAPEHKRLAIAELITRINFGIVIGNFEMDFSDGEIRYKTSIDLEGCPALPELFKPLIYANVFTVDRYFPAFMSVLYAGVSPREALAAIRGE
jgi:hypothetical protein